MIDLMSIARTEYDGGDLFGLLSSQFEPTEERPTGYPEAVVWQGGNHDGVVNPVAHCLTDAYALIGTIAAIEQRPGAAPLHPRDAHRRQQSRPIDPGAEYGPHPGGPRGRRRGAPAGRLPGGRSLRPGGGSA